MSKTRSRVKICIVAVLVIIGLVLTFASFVIPTTNTTFEGFFGAINYGYDVAGGRLSVYEVDKENLTAKEVEDGLNETIKRYNAAFSGYGMNITKQNDTIRIETSTLNDRGITSLFNKMGSSVNIFQLMASKSGIVITTDSSNADASQSITSEFFLGASLGNAQQGSGVDVYPISINLTNEGKEKLRNLTSDNSKKLYLFLDGQNYNSSGFEISSPISEFTLYAQGSQDAAKVLKLQVDALSKPINLKLVVNETITSGLDTGVDFFNSTKNILMICAGLLLLASIIYLLVSFRMLGVISLLSFGAFIAVYTFLLQSIPLVLLDLNGVIGVMFIFFLLVFDMVEIFKTMKKEYSIGKKLPNAVPSAFRKNIMKVLEKYIFILIASAVLYLVGSSALKAFAVPVFVGLFVNFFVLFVVLRGTMLSYSVINSTKANHYNFKREVEKNEI